VSSRIVDQIVAGSAIWWFVIRDRAQGTEDISASAGIADEAMTGRASESRGTRQALVLPPPGKVFAQ